MNRNILILVFLLKLSTGMKIDRDVSDTLHGASHCASTGRAEGWFSCICKPQYKTLMSSQGGDYDCKSLSEVGCEYSLQQNDQALLVTEKNLVRPIFSGTITKNDLVMEKVLVWNYDGYNGSWNDITRETERLFKVDDISGNSTLHISNLTLKALAGHAVKITFKDTKSLVFKFKGTVEYGFDLEEFKKKFEEKPASVPTTANPPLSTTAAKPATTERKSTIEKVTSTSKPKITTSQVTERKTTTVKPTTKRQMTKLSTTHPLTRPFTQTAKKRMTTVSPTLQPRHKKHFKLSFKFETQLEIETED